MRRKRAFTRHARKQVIINAKVENCVETETDSKYGVSDLGKLAESDVHLAASDGDCPICKYPLVNAVSLKTCKHEFCKPCVLEWFATSGHQCCPICRCENKHWMVNMVEEFIPHLPPDPYARNSRSQNKKIMQDHLTTAPTGEVVTSQSHVTTSVFTTQSPVPTRYSTPEAVMSVYDGSPTKLARLIVTKDPSRLSRIPVHRVTVRNEVRERSAALQRQLQNVVAVANKKISGHRLVSTNAKEKQNVTMRKLEVIKRDRDKHKHAAVAATAASRHAHSTLRAERKQQGSVVAQVKYESVA